MFEIYFCPDCGFRMIRPTRSTELDDQGHIAVFYHCPKCLLCKVRCDYQRRFKGRYQRGIFMDVDLTGDGIDTITRLRHPIANYLYEQIERTMANGVALLTPERQKRQLVDSFEIKGTWTL